MKLTAKLAHSQLKINRKRSVWTLMGIILSTSMITAVFGFAASGMEAVYTMVGDLRDVYNYMIISIGVVLSSIIVASSVIVVSNSFRVSAGERLAQFGILKSVGATKRQITEIIMYESLFLSIIGIPIGIIVGLLVQLVGVEIAAYLLEDLGPATLQGRRMFEFVVAWQAILVSVGVGFFTVLLSAWLPGRKAAKIPAINAIRRIGDVKIQAKRVRTSWLVSKLFGFEGTLASKSLKRSKRNFRATVVSLTISIVTFIAASSFGSNMERMVNVAVFAVDSDVIGSFQSSMDAVYEECGVYISHFEYTYMNNELAEAITARLRQFPNTTVTAVGSNTSSWRVSSTLVPAGELTTSMRNLVDPDNDKDEISITLALVTVDAELYSELIRIADVPHGSNILINYFRRHYDGRWMEVVPFVFNYQTITSFTTEDPVEIPLHAALLREQVPDEVLWVGAGRSMLTVVVPYLDAKSYTWFAETTGSHRELTAYMHVVFDEMIPGDGPGNVYTSAINIAAMENADRDVLRLAMVFIYGFVGMLTLIGLTNVISTISANVRSRAREFAVLGSVGMTPGGIRRMLNLESILCSVKALIFGLPLGIGASVLIYDAMMNAVFYEYQFPFMAVIQSIVAVFIISWVTMRYSAARLRGRNIVETIRSESGA